jgi:hypothetical protein
VRAGGAHRRDEVAPVRAQPGGGGARVGVGARGGRGRRGVRRGWGGEEETHAVAEEDVEAGGGELGGDLHVIGARGMSGEGGGRRVDGGGVSHQAAAPASRRQRFEDGLVTLASGAERAKAVARGAAGGQRRGGRGRVGHRAVGVDGGDRAGHCRGCHLAEKDEVRAGGARRGAAELQRGGAAAVRQDEQDVRGDAVGMRRGGARCHGAGRGGGGGGWRDGGPRRRSAGRTGTRGPAAARGRDGDGDGDEGGGGTASPGDGA